MFFLLFGVENLVCTVIDIFLLVSKSYRCCNSTFDLQASRVKFLEPLSIPSIRLFFVLRLSSSSTDSATVFPNLSNPFSNSSCW